MSYLYHIYMQHDSIQIKNKIKKGRERRYHKYLLKFHNVNMVYKCLCYLFYIY